VKKLINLSIRVTIAAIYIMGGYLYFSMNYTDHAIIEKLKDGGVEATATVLDVKQTISGPKPKVRFIADNAEKVEFEALPNESVKKGDLVTIRYNPQNNAEAVLASDIEAYPRSFKDSVFGSALFCALCAVVSAYTLFSKRFSFQLQ